MEYEINGVISTGDEDINITDFVDRIIDFCETQGWTFGGSFEGEETTSKIF